MTRDLREALLAYAAATVAVVVLVRAGAQVPLVDRNLGALVAVVFLYVPAALAWRRGEELSDYGFTVRPLGKNLGFGLGAPLLLFPLFLFGFVWFYQLICAQGAPAALARLSPPGMCNRFLGWAQVRMPGLGWPFAEAAFVQVVVVALPEELFFRGFLLRRLEQALPPRRRLGGGGIGWALVASAALFALGHVVVDLDPRRFAVFFPGLLFGWLRSATGSIAAGTMAHAASNLYIDLLQKMFFR